jgi:UDP-glucose 4-epimerase
MPNLSVRAEEMEGARILVTGGAGFIGSHLVDRLVAKNEVTVIDDLSAGTLRNLSKARGRVHLKKASILETDTMAAAIKGQQVVYHLAAKTSVPESVAKPEEYWRNNVEGTVRVLKAAADAAVRRVVFVSSAAIYGDSPETPKVESMRPDPKSPYAVTKMVGEFACEEIRGMTGMETVVVRLFNAYGPRQDPSAPYSGVMAKFSAAVAANRSLEIYGDGEQTRDFLFVGDIAEGLELAGVKPVNGATMNLGSGEAITVNEVVRILSEIVNRPIRVERKPERPGDIRHSRADVSKAKEKLGFTARTSVRDGLKKTLEDARKRAAHPS